MTTPGRCSTSAWSSVISGPRGHLDRWTPTWSPRHRRWPAHRLPSSWLCTISRWRSHAGRGWIGSLKRSRTVLTAGKRCRSSRRSTGSTSTSPRSLPNGRIGVTPPRRVVVSGAVGPTRPTTAAGSSNHPPHTPATDPQRAGQVGRSVGSRTRPLPAPDTGGSRVPPGLGHPQRGRGGTATASSEPSVPPGWSSRLSGRDARARRRGPPRRHRARRRGFADRARPGCTSWPLSGEARSRLASPEGIGDLGCRGRRDGDDSTGGRGGGEKQTEAGDGRDRGWFPAGALPPACPQPDRHPGRGGSSKVERRWSRETPSRIGGGSPSGSMDSAKILDLEVFGVLAHSRAGAVRRGESRTLRRRGHGTPVLVAFDILTDGFGAASSVEIPGRGTAPGGLLLVRCSRKVRAMRPMDRFDTTVPEGLVNAKRARSPQPQRS